MIIAKRKCKILAHNRSLSKTQLVAKAWWANLKIDRKLNFSEG